MPKWLAIAPISVKLDTETLSLGDLSITRYPVDQLKSILGGDLCYWPEVSYDLEYKSGYWLNFEVEAILSQDAWKISTERARVFFETLALFKTTYSVLFPVGILIKGKEPSLSGHFGLENTIISKPHYLLEQSEYESLVKFFNVYNKFTNENDINPNTSQTLMRIYWARHYLLKSYETTVAPERYIFLSIALEALCGEGENELRYRYANRTISYF